MSNIYYEGEKIWYVLIFVLLYPVAGDKKGRPISDRKLQTSMTIFNEEGVTPTTPITDGEEVTTPEEEGASVPEGSDVQ